MQKKRCVSSGNKLSYADKESTIERMILVWLMGQELKGIQLMFWKVKTTATYDPKIRVFRKTPPWYRLGVPDIHGFYKGLPVVIEVKSRTGKLSKDQINFKAQWLKNSRGYYLLCRSVEDVQQGFDIIDRESLGSSSI